LKSISVSIPKYQLVVLTGVSGSGKSTLGFDILHKEGQRQYMESLGLVGFAVNKPAVDSITGLSPSISVDQNLTNHSPRSTVGTVTEVFTYLRVLFAAYFELSPIGRVLGEPFVMRLDTIGRLREPDLQIILNDNPGELTDTVMIGPADTCVEVVSAESVERDYGAKFSEYEKAGVREYWIIDPLRRRCDFNRRNEAGIYVEMEPDNTGYYRTPLLPKLALHVPTLWQSELPGVIATGQAVQQMLAAE
jgi:Uma2 family endonuclease